MPSLNSIFIKKKGAINSNVKEYLSKRDVSPFVLLLRRHLLSIVKELLESLSYILIIFYLYKNYFS